MRGVAGLPAGAPLATCCLAPRRVLHTIVYMVTMFVVLAKLKRRPYAQYRVQNSLARQQMRMRVCARARLTYVLCGLLQACVPAQRAHPMLAGLQHGHHHGRAAVAVVCGCEQVLWPAAALPRDGATTGVAACPHCRRQ